MSQSVTIAPPLVCATLAAAGGLELQRWPGSGKIAGMKGKTKHTQKPRATKKGKPGTTPKPQPLEETQTATTHKGGRAAVWPMIKEHLESIETQRSLGATFIQIARALGVHVATLYRLKREQSEFCECLARARRNRGEYLAGKLWELASGAKRVEETSTIDPQTGTLRVSQRRCLYLEPSLPALMAILKREHGWSEALPPSALDLEEQATSKSEQEEKAKRFKRALCVSLGIDPDTPLGNGRDFYEFTERQGHVWSIGQYLGQTVWTGQTPQERAQALQDAADGKHTKSDFVYLQREHQKQQKELDTQRHKLEELETQLQQIEEEQGHPISNGASVSAASASGAPASTASVDLDTILARERQRLEEEKRKQSQARSQFEEPPQQPRPQLPPDLTGCGLGIF